MRTRFLLGWAIVVALAAGSVALAFAVRADDRDQFERSEQTLADRSARQAEAVVALSIRQLATASAFYQADESVSDHEFDVVARSLLRDRGFSATTRIVRVPDPRRAAFERTQGFYVTEGHGRMRRAARRGEYYPVVNAAGPGDREIGALGHDLRSDPVRASVLADARDSGRPSVTPIVPLLLSRGSGVVVYYPIYRDRAPVRSVAQRRTALAGFAGGSFRALDLANAAAGATPDDVEMQLLENGRVMVGPKGTLEDAASSPVRIADRTWTLVLRDPSGPGNSFPLAIGLIGLALAAMLGSLIFVWSRSERMQELQRLASHDSLTGLKNRRRFEEDLRTELARSRRERQPGALLMLDIDDFKGVNDTLGHPAGDRVIEEISRVLSDRIRETDVLARLGGDEFAIVLPGTDEARARHVAEAIATAVREHELAENGGRRVTVSIGVTQFGNGGSDDFDTVLSAADNAMYGAKGAGRDTIRVYDHASAGAAGRA
jgi:diguanylate cyclase (GGDEF)-like protein